MPTPDAPRARRNSPPEAVDVADGAPVAGARLRSIVEGLFDPFVVMTSVRDSSGVVVDFEYAEANAAACEDNRVDRDELIGARLLDLLPGQLSTGLFAMYRQVVETGIPMVIDDLAYEQERHGSEVRRHDVRVVKVGDGVSVSWRDVTDRYLEHEELQASRAKYRSVAAALAEGIVIVSGDGRIVESNPAAWDILGLSEQELNGRTALDAKWDVVDEDGRPFSSDRHPVVLALNTEKAAPGVVMGVRRPAGGTRWILVHAEPIAGTTSGGGDVVASFIDITALRRAQDSLDEAQARYRLLAEHSSDFVAQTIPDGTIEWVSPSVVNATGWTPQDLLGRSGFDFFHPDDLELVMKRAAPLEAGEAVYGKSRVRCADGSYRWFAQHVRPVRDSAGTIVARVHSWRDAAHEVEVERALADSEERHRLLAENASDVVMLVHADGMLDWVSPSVERVLGWDAAELVGTAPWHLMHPDDVGRVASTLAREVAGGVAATEEARMLQRDGSYRWMSAAGHPVGDGRVVVGLRDVQAEREGREALAASEEHYRLLADNSSDVVVRAAGGVVHWVSPSLTETLGWTREEWLDHRLVEFVVAADLREATAWIESIESGASRVERLRAVAKDGATHWMEVHARPYQGPDGVVDGIVLALRTVDDQVAAEQSLERRARYDPLTGLHNRAEALDRLAALTGQPRRDDYRCAVAFCDLDNLKTINDTLGHALGDEVLRAVALRISSTVRSGDLVARVGGDEFLIVLDGVDDLGRAVEIVEKVRQIIAIPVLVRGGRVTTSVSIGVTLAAHGEAIDVIVARADRAMYEAKDSGRDRVVAVPVPSPS